MASRLDLQLELETLLGSRQVYFQPPESVKLSYPAIVYELNSIDNRFADDDVYNQNTSYSVKVIDRNPDSEIAKRVSRMKTCRFNRSYSADNLNHYVFVIYY